MQFGDLLHVIEAQTSALATGAWARLRQLLRQQQVLLAGETQRVAAKMNLSAMAASSSTKSRRGKHKIHGLK